MSALSQIAKIARYSVCHLVLIGATVNAQSCERHIESLDQLIKNQYVQRDWSNFWLCQILISMELRKDSKLTQRQIAQLYEARRLAVRLKNDRQDALCREAIAKSLKQINA